MIFGKHINKYYLKYGLLLLCGIFALVAVDWFQLEIPALYKLVVNGINDGVAVKNGKEYIFNMKFVLDEICAPLLVVILVMVIGRCLWRVFFFGSTIMVERDLRAEMFERSKRLSPQYYQVHKVGDLMSLYTNDLDTIAECFENGFLMSCDALFLGGLALYKMANMNVFLTLLILIPAIVMLVAGTLLGIKLTKKWDERQQAFSDISDFTQENFSGIAVIKAFVKEVKELHAFRKLNKNNEKANVGFVRFSVLLDILITFAIESTFCIILGYGGYLVHSGKFNAGELIEFIGYFNSIIWPVIAIAQLIGMSARGKASLKRVGELLDTPTDVKDRENVETLKEVKGEIEFKHLSFTYPKSEVEVLSDVSFRIKPGESVGIFGKTGAGKTTIVELILRAYNVADGTLFIDGHDVNDVSISSLRDFCAYVPQDNFLFSDTIEHNIAFGKDGEEKEIKEAAVLADVYQNIEAFPAKYKTVLGERGVTVSGGQKQRISIARALLKDAPILILDDSVSAVDTSTEKTILENLKKTRKGKTTILIAHRVSTVSSLDKILFIEDGKVLDFGSHDELYARCKAYRLSVDLQKLEDEHKEAENA